MRYTHHIHRANHLKNPRIQRRQRLTSLVFIIAVVLILLITSRSHAINWAEYYTYFASSLVSVVIAYLISAVLALGLALGATKNKTVENILLPILDVAQSFPTFALIPVLLVLFGTTRWVVVCFLVVTIIWPITFTLISAVKTERRDLAEAATIYGACGYKRLRYYLLPVMFPSFITGSIIGWGEAWEALIGAEIIAKVTGIGSLLGQISDTNRLQALILAIAMYLFLIFLLNQVVWLPLLNISSRYQNEQ